TRPDLPGDARASLAEAASMLDASVKGLGGIEDITRRLKRFARTQSGGEPVDVNEIVRSIAKVAEARIPPNVQVRLDAQARQAPRGRAGEISQIVLNLLLNASESMGQREGRIQVRTRDEPGHVLVEVEDDGPGIPPETQAHIFESFYTTKPEGTGLGLSISHLIAREHGGSLTFTSAPGERTLFRLTLPVAGG
ncbi:MAG TPA: ATP-binding protein, partial [Candidatus Thermoplasmatota archaeon]|nr:ATP-binding protein [Candidatus Thermoplasmatota archaeon]